MKLSKNIDEVCYPHIHETSYLCDFEVITDELCCKIALIISTLEKKFIDIHQDLARLQPLLFHLNGSIRGRLAITNDDHQWLLARYEYYKKQTQDNIKGFILPGGDLPVPYLYLARSGAKKAIRAMVRIEQEGIVVPQILPRFCHVLCNLLFVMAVCINRERDYNEIEFHSKSYGKR